MLSLCKKMKSIYELLSSNLSESSFDQPSKFFSALMRTSKPSLIFKFPEKKFPGWVSNQTKIKRLWSWDFSRESATKEIKFRPRSFSFISFWKEIKLARMRKMHFFRFGFKKNWYQRASGLQFQTLKWKLKFQTCHKNTSYRLTRFSHKAQVLLFFLG